MTDTQAPSGRSRVDLIFFGGVLLIVILGIAMFSASRQQDLRASPTGFDGLQSWLGGNGLTTQNFLGGWRVDQEQVDLLILPLFDSDLGAAREIPRTEEEFLQQQDENDAILTQIIQRAERAQTLVILPKWRSGMRLTGLAHPELLIEQARLNRLFQTLTGQSDARVTRNRNAFTTFSYELEDGIRARAELYAAQTVSSTECRPILGTRAAMVVGECPLGDDKTRAIVVVDPDLLNNHGLVLGENAVIGADLITQLVAERRAETDDEGLILIDYARRNWLYEARSAPVRERSWSDLLRFFEPPFTLLWLGAGICLLIALWRGGLRDGPVRALSRRAGISKTLAISARARLMRLTGQDGRLVNAYATARVAATANALLGPAHGPAYSSDAAFQKYVARRHPRLSPRLSEILDRVRTLPDKIAASEAAHLVEDLETILEDIAHDT
ncbi:MAG: hypothetical protein AAFN09_07265 [Pseudomonadota bacterium]